MSIEASSFWCFWGNAMKKGERAKEGGLSRFCSLSVCVCASL